MKLIEVCRKINGSVDKGVGSDFDLGRWVMDRTLSVKVGYDD
jgi:hypothetical protein